MMQDLLVWSYGAGFLVWGFWFRVLDLGFQASRKSAGCLV